MVDYIKNNDYDYIEYSEYYDDDISNKDYLTS